jgi:hypothetical protein
LDRIDRNIEQVVESVVEGNRQLLIAEERQKSGRAAKCIRLLWAMIFLNILWIVFKTWLFMPSSKE